MRRELKKLLMKLHGTGAGETLQGERQVYHHPTKIPMPSASSAIPQDPTPHPGLASPTPDVPAPANSNDFRRKYCQLPRPTLKIYMNKLPLRSPTGASQRKTSGHAPPPPSPPHYIWPEASAVHNHTLRRRSSTIDYWVWQREIFGHPFK